jgi:predicted ATP-grasp superfamily ATP-dependent carboligase
VLLGGRGPALSAARALGSLGVPVHVLAPDAAPVARSRFCRDFVARDGADDRTGAWMDWLEREGPRGAALLPCCDDGLELVARNRAQLEALGYLPIAGDDEAMLAMLDKEATYARARALGVPAPGTVTVRTARDIERAVDELGFPCAIKPVHSHLWQRHFRAKLIAVEDEVTLRATLAHTRRLGLEVLVTEIIPGADDQFISYYTYLDTAGRPLFHFTKRKLRGYPIHFGLWTYQVVEWHPDAAALGLRFFEGVGVRGVVNVEFKRDARDGTLKLIECNHRFTAANELVARAGVDIVRLAYGELVGVPMRPDAPAREGARLWSTMDIAAFLSYRAAGELSTTAWLRSLLRPFHVRMLRLDDPLPFLSAVGEDTRKLRHALSRDRVGATVRRGTQQA